MDDFVRHKLTQWNLEELISRFQDQGIDKESLFYLEDQDINDLISKVGPRVRFKKRLRRLQGVGVPREKPRSHGVKKKSRRTNAAARNQTNDLLTTRRTHHQLYKDAARETYMKNDLLHRGRGKRSLDLQVGTSEETPRAKRQCDSASMSSEQTILSDVKNTMTHVCTELKKGSSSKFTDFLKTKISDLETDKRELVGVFGKTGAGKSTLINAVLGQKNLLPTGSFCACTSTMIKVEANVHNQKYVAEIEFITEEEWKDELWTMISLLNNEAEKEDPSDDNNDEIKDYKQKLSAVYGEGWIGKTPDKLMERRNFTEIPNFLEKLSKKTLTCETVEMLSAEIGKYTKDCSIQDESRKRSYWPLVKCVTVKVPQNKLQHITLIDLPGNGDRNKSRNAMWKGVVGNCSTVWVVTEITRAASENDTWDILKNAASLLGNGGECQRIHFICTKTDKMKGSADYSTAKVKEAVKREFNDLSATTKQFSKDCFEVFTVAAEDYQEGENPENNEIPSLKKVLENLNDCHSETLNYVSGAYGILSLMQGATYVVDKKEAVCEEIEKKKSHQLSLVEKEMDKTYAAFEKCLTEGVEKSKSSCEKKLMSILKPVNHATLKKLVQNGGIWKPSKKKKEINLNMALSSFLTNSIDEEFRETFPNERKCAPFNGVISKFSLDTEKLKQKYENAKLQLIFLETEEGKIKCQLNTLIRDRKKVVYRCLTEIIEETMKECYERAATHSGKGSLEFQRDIIQSHVRQSMDTMFDKAKDAMLDQLRKLKEKILETLGNSIQESIEISLKTDKVIIPDVSSHLEKVEKLYNELKSSSDKETSNQSCSESMMQESVTETQPAVRMENV